MNGLYYRRKRPSTIWIDINCQELEDANPDQFGFEDFDFKLNDKIYETATKEFVRELEKWLLWERLRNDRVSSQID